MTLDTAVPFIGIGAYALSIGAIYRFATIYMNGRMVLWENKLEDTVTSDSCHQAQNRMSEKFKGVESRIVGVESRMTDGFHNIENRLEDIKDLIKRNGNHAK